MKKLCKELQENEKLINIFKRTSYFETLKILYDRQVKLEVKFEQMQEIKNL